MDQDGENDEERVLEIWQNEKRPDRAGFAAGGTFVPLYGNPITPVKSDKVSKTAAMPVQATQVTAVAASGNRNDRDISRIDEFGYTVDKTGNNYHCDNYVGSKREIKHARVQVPFAFSFLKISPESIANICGNYHALRKLQIKKSDLQDYGHGKVI